MCLPVAALADPASSNDRLPKEDYNLRDRLAVARASSPAINAPGGRRATACRVTLLCNSLYDGETTSLDQPSKREGEWEAFAKWEV